MNKPFGYWNDKGNCIEECKKYNIEWMKSEEVTGIDTKEKKVNEDTGEVLHQQTNHSHCQSRESRFLITILNQHLAGRDAHEEIGCKVHHISHHACPAICESPYITKWRSHIRNKGNHCKHKTHRDNGDEITIFLFLTHDIKRINN